MRLNVIKIKKMELEKKVINMIKESLEYNDEINMNDNLVNKLGADSLDMLMLINTLEDSFSIRIEDEDLKDLKTVSDVIEELKVKLGKNKNE